MESIRDRAAPMPSAPMKYLPDGTPDWGNMWDTFCLLAQDGGPPHRATTLLAQEEPDMERDDYRYAMSEIARGIHDVSGLTASAGPPGWIAVHCPAPGMAGWLAEAIVHENVEARSDGSELLVPVGNGFTVEGEIKNVITAVAKTTHYWSDHLPSEVKQTLAFQAQLAGLKERFKGWLRRAS